MDMGKESVHAGSLNWGTTSRGSIADGARKSIRGILKNGKSSIHAIIDANVFGMVDPANGHHASNVAHAADSMESHASKESHTDKDSDGVHTTRELDTAKETHTTKGPHTADHDTVGGVHTASEHDTARLSDAFESSNAAKDYTSYVNKVQSKSE